VSSRASISWSKQLSNFCLIPVLPTVGIWSGLSLTIIIIIIIPK
jgi:hypothetical protein